VNFQQAGQRVEDGQHLSFVGTIMSSRYFYCVTVDIPLIVCNMVISAVVFIISIFCIIFSSCILSGARLLAVYITF